MNKTDIKDNPFFHLYNEVEETWKDITMSLSDYHKMCDANV